MVESETAEQITAPRAERDELEEQLSGSSIRCGTSETTYVRGHRENDTQRPFDLVVGGATSADAARARDVIGPLRDAGATWWDERQLDPGPDVDCLAPVLRRIEAEPPVLN